jgi:hypothetical protein
MPKLLETFGEFAGRQTRPDGNPCESVVVGTQMSPRTGMTVSRVVFENGAVSDANESHFDPPTDPRARLLVRQEYLKARLDKEEREWTDYKTWALEQTALHDRFPNNCPMPPANALELLHAGAGRILKLRDELTEVEKQLDPDRQKREAYRRQQENDRSSRVRSFQTAVQSITLTPPATPPLSPSELLRLQRLDPTAARAVTLTTEPVPPTIDPARTE